MQTMNRGGTATEGAEVVARRIFEGALLERHRSLLEAVGVAVYTTDAAGRITFFNEAAAELWGRRPEIGVDLWCGSWRIYTTEGEPLPHDECPMAITLKENRPVRGVEAIAERPDGTRFWFMPFPTPLRDEDGNLVGAVNVLVDVTERRRAEEKAAEAIRESMAIKDQFLGLVSHELRTPIATILGNALLLLRRGDALPDDDKKQALRDVAGEAEKLQLIIENLLLLTRVDVGQELECEPVRLPVLLGQEVAEFQRRRPRRPVELKVEGDIPLAAGQPPLLRLVLDNLLGNADKYSPPEAPIEVRIRAGGGELEICVRDFGIGMSAEEAGAVFTPFIRTERAMLQAKGLGLGLAVCKRVIEAQGGSIRAEARPEGGTDFVFTLPQLTDSA